jgi:hypothetical protein
VGKFSEEPGSRDGVGTNDYQIYTIFYFPTGVVDFLDSFYPDFVFQYFEYDMNNQPPRPQTDFAIC